MNYFAATRNNGFNRGPMPAPFEFKGTSGWTITIYMNSKDVVVAR